MPTIPGQQIVDVVACGEGDMHCVICGSWRECSVRNQCFSQFNNVIAQSQMGDSLQRFQSPFGGIRVTTSSLLKHK